RFGLAFELVHRWKEFAPGTEKRRCLTLQTGEKIGRLRVTAQGAENVEAHDVARTFPDRIDRRFAIQPRQDAFLDVAVAAEALHRLVDEARRRLADPIF